MLTCPTIILIYRHYIDFTIIILILLSLYWFYRHYIDFTILILPSLYWFYRHYIDFAVIILILPSQINVKLADYGISRFSTFEGLKLQEGTPSYRAPEVIRGETYSFQVFLEWPTWGIGQTVRSEFNDLKKHFVPTITHRFHSWIPGVKLYYETWQPWE